MKVVCRWTVLSHLLLLATAEHQTPFSAGVGGVEPKSTPIIPTSSGFLIGRVSDGISSFKGIRFAEPPVGEYRWTPPRPYISREIIQADTFGPSCIQQFPYATANLTKQLFNTPPPSSESEDCLFLNVWAPTDRSERKPVLVWFYGGSLAFGYGSHPGYDGTTFAQNQSVIVVTFNYRTNVFGFPGYSAYTLPRVRNFGFMDQDLALEWVRNNIAAFGGDPNRITINGESAGSMSVGHMLQRHTEYPPFRAAIMQSGAASSISLPPTDRDAFRKFVTAHNCTQWKPEIRLECLRNLSTETVQTWLNGVDGAVFSPTFDDVTAFCDPYRRILRGETANVPLLIGANQDDGSLFAPMPPSNQTLDEWLLPFTILLGIAPNTVRQLYPDRRDDRHIIADVIRDAAFLCPSQLTAESFQAIDQPDVYRYVYGAKFSPEPFPDAGAWHSSEVELIFGTYDKTNATAEMQQLSETLQTIWANFIRDPYRPPHHDWPRYDGTPGTQTLAKLGFNGTALENVVELSLNGVYDMPCHELWNQRLVDNTFVGCGF